MDKIANPAPGFRRNPDHTITIRPYPGTVTVKFFDAVIASSDNVQVLKEGSYPEVLYIPFEDIYFDFLRRSDSSTHCPYKGNASYWSVSAADEGRSDVMWAYETPYDEVLAIKDHGAFYPSKVTIEMA